MRKEGRYEDRKVGDRIKSVRDSEVYKRVFDCATKIFEITKNFRQKKDTPLRIKSGIRQVGGGAGTS